MKKGTGKRPEMTVEEIVAIRESLHLTRAEAGKLLGGGPNAYAKYEAGIVKPSAAAANLLRLLEAYPGMLDTLPGAESPAMPVRPSARSPFEVSGKDIGDLSRTDLPALLRRLLAAEAEAHELPADGIHVADITDAPDGGEDGRITWENGPERTRFLPSRRCQFQLKSGRVQPAQAGREMLDKDGAVKSMIREFLEEDGHYLMLCTHPYTQKAIKERKDRILAALGGAGLKVARNRIRFLDASQIASWTNCRPAVAQWVKEKTGRGVLGSFRSWSHWNGRAEHAAPWVEDERLPAFRTRLLEQVARPCGIARVAGPSGIGKSRLTLQALGPAAKDWSISGLVLYADEAEASPNAINETVQRLADSGARAIAVVNRCTPERHRMLENMALRESSRLSLITIDEEATGTAAEAVLIEVRKPAAAVIETIIDRTSPGLPPEDRRRLVRFAADNPGTAIRVARAWRARDERKSGSLAQATDDGLADAIVLGRRPHKPNLLRKAAALLAAFGLVDPGAKDEGELSAVAKLGRSLTGDDLYAAMADLANRDVIHQRGDLMLFPASPVSMRLTERQWREWPPSKWDKILAGGIGRHLDLRAAQRLALLNDTDIARKVVTHVCRADGPLGGMLGESSATNTAILAPLAEIDTKVVVELLDRALNEIGDRSTIRGTGEIVRALNRIAFHSDTFADGARLLLRLAAKNRGGINSAARQFISLFPVCLGNTAADGEARLEFLDERIEADRPDERAVIVDALTEGLRTSRFRRFVGIESHGSRPALEPWLPDTHGTAREYLSGCVDHLARLAERDDETGRDARASLGRKLRGLLNYGLADSVEQALAKVRNATGCWTEAIDSLGGFLKYDTSGKNQELILRVRELSEQLLPRELEDRGRLLVTSMPRDYPVGQELSHEERHRLQVQKVGELAAEFTKQPEKLKRFLPEISRGRQRMAFEFGRALAGDAEAPPDWLEQIAAAVAGTPAAERNFDLLCGYLAGIYAKHPDTVRDFKRRAAGSSELVPALPALCRNCSIEPADIRLVIDALDAGRLQPDNLLVWDYSKPFTAMPAAAAAPLFDRLLGGDAEAFRVGICLLGPYAEENPGKVEDLQPQVLRAAENSARCEWAADGGMPAHYFEQLMRKALEKGWRDAGARAVALALAEALANPPPAAALADPTLAEALADNDEWSDGGLARAVLPLLLSEFTEIAWPVLGQAIVSAPNRGDRFREVLGNQGFDAAEIPPILSLPEEVLLRWCRKHPKRAPAFAASAVPVLDDSRGDDPSEALHPLLSRLLDEFGERQDVLDEIGSNIRDHVWSERPTDCCERFQKLLEPLRAGHPKKPVQRWAKEMLHWLRERAKSSREAAEVRQAHRGV